MNRTTRRLARAQVLRGYRLCLQNVDDLLGAALAIVQSTPAAALALGQVAQEELGKSMLLLCAVTFDAKPDWREFWRRWTNHDAKSHMAAWYEWLDTLRITLTAEDGTDLDGLPLRERYSLEKEVGLYVDFDDASACFVSPGMRVTSQEALNRLAAVSSLALTATTVYDVLQSRDVDFRTDTVSRHMRRLWSEFELQQAMHAALNALGGESDAHSALSVDLRDAFNHNRATLRKDFSPEQPG